MSGLTIAGRAQRRICISSGSRVAAQGGAQAGGFRYGISESIGGAKKCG